MGRASIIGLSWLLVLAACSSDQGPKGEQGEQGEQGPAGESVEVGYVTSAVCRDCHEKQYASWVNTGHPYKIVPKADIVDGDDATGYPLWVRNIVHGAVFAVDADFFDTGQGGDQVLTRNTDTFPNGWDDITYVIGGYGWKARFINNSGYIITGLEEADPDDTSDDDKTQYNFPLVVDAVGAAPTPTFR